MIEDVKKFILSCDLCQRVRHANSLPVGLLHPLPIPESRFESLNIDFADMPMSKSGLDSFMLIKDRFSKIIGILPCKKDITAKQAAELLYRNWYLLGYGFPKSIVSDRDAKFTAVLWRTFCERTGIDQAMATSRHQQTDGGAEIMIRMVKTALKKFTSHKQDDWDEFIPLIQFAYNNSINATTGFSPFYLAHAFQPSTFPNFKTNDTLLLNFTKHSDDLEIAHQHIFDSQQQMIQSYNGNHQSAPQYKIGDLVLLNRDGIQWPSSTNVSAKLLQPYLGPFEILAIDSEKDNVTIKLPVTMRCHNVFHVSKLKKWIRADTDFPGRSIPANPLSELDPDGEDSFEVDAVLDTRLRYKKRQFLIRWLGYDSSHDTWEPIECLKYCPDKLEEFLEEHPIKGFSLVTALEELGEV